MKLDIRHLLGLAPWMNPKSSAKSKGASPPARAEMKKKVAPPPAKAKPVKPKLTSSVREIERHTLARMEREDQPPHTPFLHLLRESKDKPHLKAAEHSSPARAEPPKTGLTKIARRTIANCARLRGENLAEVDVERRLREDDDRALGIQPSTREIFDRINARNKH